MDENDDVIEDTFGILLQYGVNGGFIERFMVLWRTADNTNKQILKSAATSFIHKYSLLSKAESIKSSNPEAKASSLAFWNGVKKRES